MLQQAASNSKNLLSGETYNQMIQVVNRAQLGGSGRVIPESVNSFSDSGMIRMQNNTGSNLDRFSIVKPNDFVIHPFQSGSPTTIAEFKNEPAFICGIPALKKKFIITADPMMDQAYGYAIGQGLSVVKLSGSPSATQTVCYATTSLTTLTIEDPANLAVGDWYGVILHFEAPGGDVYGVVAFPFVKAAGGGGDPDPTLNYWWTMDWEKVDASYVPITSGTMNFNLGVRFRAEPDYAPMAGVEWTDNWTQTNHVLVFAPQSPAWRIEFTAFTISLDYQFPGPYQYDCGSGNHIIYQTPVLSGTVDPGENSEPDNT